MDFVFETRTSMKSFANSLSNGSILWTLEGTPEKGSFFQRDSSWKGPLYLGESIIPIRPKFIAFRPFLLLITTGIHRFRHVFLFI